MVDYAGTFPPAALDLRAAADNYARYREAPASWLLGRFIVAADDLEAFEECAAPLFSRGPARDPWRLSVICGDNMPGSVRAVQRFVERREKAGAAGHAIVECVEYRVARADDVREKHAVVPPRIRSVFEVSGGQGLEAVLRAIRAVDGVAKYRAGAATPDLVPSVVDFARFIVLCAKLGVTMKATAGLHHALRGEHPLGESGQAALQHGFLNVLVATALARDRVAEKGATHDVLMMVETVLDERDPAAFVFGDDALAWWDYRLAIEQVARARADFFTGFGSCSFDEPVADLRAMGLEV